jgi:hypothetical protein
MKVIVKHQFRDKHTKELYRVGQELTITKKRFDEILKKGDFIKEKEEEK